jgi:hypothetical protein
MVLDRNGSSGEGAVVKRLVAALVVCSLLVSGPGCSDIWAAVVPEGFGGGQPVGAVAAASFVPLLPGGSALPPGMPAGWTLVPSGLWVPPTALPAGALPAPETRSPSSVLSSRTAPLPSRPTGTLSNRPPLQYPSAARIQSPASRQDVRDIADVLRPERLGILSGEEAKGGSDRLQRLLQSGAGGEEAPLVAAWSEQGSGVLAPNSGTAVRSVALRSVVSPRNGLNPPEPASPADRTDSFRSTLAVTKLWLRSFKYFFVALSLKNWRDYKAQRQAAQVRHALSVSDGRQFFVDIRMMGMAGGLKPFGSFLAPHTVVAQQAVQIFNRYFDHPDMGTQARAAFYSFLGRAMLFNEGRRYADLRKQVRITFQQASLVDPRDLKAFFDEQLPAREVRRVARYQKSRQAQDLSDLREAVLATLREEELDKDLDPSRCRGCEGQLREPGGDAHERLRPAGRHSGRQLEPRRSFLREVEGPLGPLGPRDQRRSFRRASVEGSPFARPRRAFPRHQRRSVAGEEPEPSGGRFFAPRPCRSRPLPAGAKVLLPSSPEGLDMGGRPR